MKSRLRPQLLQDNRYGTMYPSPTQKVIDTSKLNGGLNLWELDYKLDPNQSPDLVNVYWQDGSLSSRPGQEYIYDATDEESEYYGEYGNFYAGYESLWHGFAIAHKGTKLYKIDTTTGEHTSIYSGTLAQVAGGTFFVFGDKLYYMDGQEYICITYAEEVIEGVVVRTLTASNVDPYVPIVIVNRKPDGTGGSIFQDENRLSPKKRIQFTADGSSTAYHLPSSFTPLDGTGVRIEMQLPSAISYKEVQAYANRSSFPATGYVDVYYKANDTNKYYLWSNNTYSETTAPTTNQTFTVNRESGVITFNTAPAQSTLTPSNVEVTISKTNQDTIDSILKSTCATVYGADLQLAVVCGGTVKQPNAYFWSGSTTEGLDPTYFPFDYYNYAGASADEYITGFGKQQSMLVIFQENRIGKSHFETLTVDDMVYLKLPYTPINESIGCNIEKSIRLIQNNLVFANTYGGVYVLLDSSAYGENTIKRISRNINGDGTERQNTLLIEYYQSASSFPNPGKLGIYYKDITTEKYYEWNDYSSEYDEIKMVPPSSGLLYDLRSVASTAVSTLDDQQRYWIVANGHAYLWDYTLSSYQKKEENICWFYLENIRANSFLKHNDSIIFGMPNGSIGKFISSFTDFGAAMPRRYTFATQNFGTYEVLKDVLKVIFAVRSDTDSSMTIMYKTDYGYRADLTPIRAFSYRLVPRDLSKRSLKPKLFATQAVRTPRCFHIRHFSMTLTNNTLGSDMSIVSAQIVYRYGRGDR